MVAPSKNLLDPIEIGDFRFTIESVKCLYSLSDTFLRSFDLYKAHIDSCCDDRDVRIYNIALLINCVAYIENVLNQKLELEVKTFSEQDIRKYKKSSKMSEKWDLVQEHANSKNLWDRSNAVFSDFDALLSLRNEILHYKCDFLESTEVPSKNIKRIMCEVCDEAPFGNKPLNTLMRESWCEHLLKHKRLSLWSIKTTQKLLERL